MHALFRCLATLALSLACAESAFAGSLSLAWDAAVDPRVAGYRIYYGTASRSYAGQVDVGNTTARTVSNLTDGGIYYFAVVAYDASRVESAYSNEVVGTVPTAVPVANFTASTVTGPAPLALNFTSTSTGSISTYAWSFGDGTTSSSQNPAKTYSTAGTYTVSLTVTGSGGSNTRTVPNYISVSAGAVPAPPAAPTTVALIEYYNASFDHYFVTYLEDEITKLDTGKFAGWARTGRSFNAWASASGSTSPVCRFFSSSFAPKSSHFYTSFDSECAKVRMNADWTFEGVVFHVALPDAEGACPAGTQPVYRIYNAGAGGAPNHRFTTDFALQQHMLARGWVAEGLGTGVTMCAPQ